MFARSASIALLALPILASAASRRGGPSRAVTHSCNMGSLMCCEDIQDTKHLDSSISGLLNLLHIDVNDIAGKVGVTCTPITAVGTSATSCAGQPTCCIDTGFNGVIAIGCSPSVINT